MSRLRAKSAKQRHKIIASNDAYAKQSHERTGSRKVRVQPSNKRSK